MSATATKGTTLITSASGGLGAIYADRLAKRGYDLILVARNTNRLAVLAQRLKDATSRSVETIAADLNNQVDLTRIGRGCENSTNSCAITEEEPC